MALEGRRTFSAPCSWPSLCCVSASTESFFIGIRSNGFEAKISSSTLNLLLHFLHLAKRPIISGFIRYRWLHALFGQAAIMVRRLSAVTGADYQCSHACSSAASPALVPSRAGDIFRADEKCAFSKPRPAASAYKSKNFCRVWASLAPACRASMSRIRAF